MLVTLPEEYARFAAYAEKHGWRVHAVPGGDVEDPETGEYYEPYTQILMTREELQPDDTLWAFSVTLPDVPPWWPEVWEHVIQMGNRRWEGFCEEQRR